MKILLIHTEGENETAGRLRALLEKTGIIAVDFPLSSQAERDIEQFALLFGSRGTDPNDKETANPTHAVILSSLSRGWFDFLAGFSYGSRLPFLVYSQEAIAGISMEFAPCFTFLDDEDALLKYLEAENEVFKKQEAAREIIKAQETLLGMGVPLNVESLAQCVSEGRIHEVSIFLAAGFSPDTRNKAGVPLLNIAARTGNWEILRFLIMADAQVNLQAEDRGSSALMDSIMGKHFDLVNDLIKAGTDPNIRNKNGQSALLLAAGNGDEKMIEILLKAGADPDLQDNMGLSARSYAALFKNSSMAALFDAYAPPKEV